MHVYKFTRIDCPSHYLEENIEPFLYLQYSKCVHESRSRNISKGNSSGRNIWLISSNTDKNPVKHHHEKKLIYPVDWVDNSAKVKINGSNEEMLAYAAEQFGSKPWVHEIWAVLESQKHN